MKKKAFIEQIVQCLWGRHYGVRSGENGQTYVAENKDDPRDFYPIWVDDLKGRRISIKIKPFPTSPEGIARASRIARALMIAAYSIEELPIDTSTKADIYTGFAWGRGPRVVARLRCYKLW